MLRLLLELGGLKLFPNDTDIVEQEKYSWINELLKNLSKRVEK